MKYFTKLLFTFLAVNFLLASCNKFLDTEPLDSLSPDFYYNNEAEMDNALAGVYDILGSDNLYGNILFSKLEAPSDLSFYRRNNVSSGPEVLNYDASSAEIRNMWTDLYKGINRANLFLENINKPQDISDTKRAQIEGEARFLRAYYYFLLVSNWGGVPLIKTSELDLGKTEVERNPATEVYDFVISEMTESVGKLPDIRSLGFGGRVTKSAARGILARVNLYMAGKPYDDSNGYSEALKWAKEVINDGGAAHKLNPDYKQIFINYAQDKYDVGESIWEVEFWGNRIGNAYQESGRIGNTNGIQCGDDAEGYSYGFIGATHKIYQLYEDIDNRRDWVVAPYQYQGQTSTKVAWTAAQIYQRMNGKFRREYELLEKQKNWTPQNFPLLRYSDVLLMAAEAENEVNGPTEDAHNWLNEVRRRAGATEYNTANGNLITSKDDFRKVMQDERARELAFEALRTHDLKRWGIYEFNIRAVANEINQNAPAGFKYSALAGQNVARRHLLYPIPLGERALNSKLTQNPEW